ncbi:SMI1/KNR4 family protein [Chitinophaga barathri]|nr:SMI1/KNR4 family protein [Chitinophaga barathri]
MEWTFEKILDQWKREGIKLSPGASPDQIRQAEEALSFEFPEDFKAFYMLADGFAEMDLLANLVAIWPLERIIKEYEAAANKDFIGFSDFMINSYDVGFLKTRPGLYKDFRHLGVEYLAESFTRTIRLVFADDDVIY